MKRSARVFFALAFAPFLMVSPQRSEGAEGYAGTQACADCHPNKYDGYIHSYHGVKGDHRTPAARNGCETCHGPGQAHVEAGGGRGVGGILVLGPKSPLPPDKKSAFCLQCHTKGKVVLWDGSLHNERGLSCSNCHNIHRANPKFLTKPIQYETCTQCHKDMTAQLRRQSHHPLREGKIQCTNCHNPHGTVADHLIDAQYVNLKCYECHAEWRGPFLWEHPPVVEACLTCHTPHGSVHERLLRAKLPYLCQRCHSGSRHPGTLYARSIDQSGQSVYRVLNNRAFYRGCLNCHSQIHGSNHPSGKTLLR
jgi:DmsE family decaheme c-type cytochrome